MLDVAIFAALGWEVRAVTQALSGLEAGDRPGTWHGYLGDGASCGVVRTGMGPARAAAAAAAAPPARLYVSSGCAGGVVEWLRAGDLVSATSVIRLHRDGQPAERLAIADVRLTAWAAGRGFRVHAGPLASTPAILATGGTKADAAATGALAVDMESGAIGAAARARGASFLVLRVVLDEAGQELPIDPSLIDDTGEVRVARALATSALHPGRWRALVRLGRQRRRAERSLRACLAVVLGGGLDALGLPPSAAWVATG